MKNDDKQILETALRATMRTILKTGFKRSSKRVRKKLDRVLTDQFLRENFDLFLSDSNAVVDKIIRLIKE